MKVAEMADNTIPGVSRITPTFPVKPPQPADKERDSERRRRQPERTEKTETDDDDDKPTIDEYV